MPGQIVADGTWCTECEYFEVPDDDGTTCLACGCPVSVHAPALVVTKADVSLVEALDEYQAGRDDDKDG